MMEKMIFSPAGEAIVTSQAPWPSLMSMILPSMQLRADIFIFFLQRGGRVGLHELLMGGTLYVEGWLSIGICKKSHEIMFKYHVYT